VTAKSPVVYADACVFLEVLQQTNPKWRDSFKVLLAAERGDISLVASRLLAVEIGRFRGDASQSQVDQLVLQYLECVGTEWAEVDLLISRDARALSWQYGLKSGADSVHLATAVRMGADYFMSRNGGFPYGRLVGSTQVIEPGVVWAATLDDVAADNEAVVDPDIPRIPVALDPSPALLVDPTQIVPRRDDDEGAEIG
jgi:predicted nucleic acid-binding protein